MSTNRLLRRARATAIAAGIAVAILALTSCTSGGEGSRHYIYSSLDELVGDSKVVVTGTAGERHSEEIDGLQFTTYDFLVDEEHFPEGLGIAPIDENTPAYTNDRLPGDSISVRQVGPPGMGPGPNLESGSKYLLFLVPTGLSGDAPTMFYITGGVAGMFKFEGDSYQRVSEEDEGLPKALEPASLIQDR